MLVTPVVMGAPFCDQAKARGAVPVAVTVKVTLAPVLTVCVANPCVMAGGVPVRLTVRVAVELVTWP